MCLFLDTLKKVIYNLLIEQNKKQFHGKKGGNEMRNVILERFKEGKKTIGTLTHMKSMTAVEAIGAAGMDYVMIDMEHSPVTIDEASRLITAADAAGIDAVARSGSAGRTDVLKLLDVGAKGVIVPGIESKEQVEELVRYAKFAPQGARGYCMTRDGKWGFSDEYAGGLGEYMKRANEGTMLIPQCETTGCLEQIEEITAMDGVDGVLIGPYDLSLGMGLGGSFDSPEFNEAVCRIKTACNKNNKVCITFTGDPDQISEKIEQGYDSVLFGLDVLALIGYYKNVVDVFNKCGV